MARGNTIPKDPEKRQRRNADTAGTTSLSGGAVKAPALPGARKLRAETRAWYRTWAGSPQAAQFLATDWQRLHMTALLVDRFYATDDGALAIRLLGEIRLNEQKLGATPEDRLRLRWRMQEADREDERAERSATKRSSRSGRDPRLTLVGKKPA